MSDVFTARAAFEPIPFRIRIGVTGHRNGLGNEAELARLVSESIETDIDDLFAPEARRHVRSARGNGSPPVRYSVVTALAEGADRLVALAILDYDKETRVDAVLPLVVQDYLDDFETPESKNTFRQILDRCVRQVTLRHHRIAEEYPDPEQARLARREAYFRAGRYVVDHCDVVIAIWDGKAARGTGGTAEVVEYARKRRRPVVRVWDGRRELLDRGTGLSDAGLLALKRFNEGPVTGAERTAAIHTRYASLFAGGEQQEAEGIPETLRERVRNNLLPYAAQASCLAALNRDQFLRAGTYVYLLSALAVASVAIAILFEPLRAPGFIAEFILLATMGLTLRKTNKRHAHEAWIENRFLAERLRSATFLAICGVEPIPIEVPRFMGHAHESGDWTLRAFDDIWGRLPRTDGCEFGLCLTLKTYIRSRWIQNQIRHHKDNRDKHRKYRERIEWAATAVLPVTMIAALLHLALPLASSALIDFHPLETLLTFVAITFPAIAASLAGTLAQRDHLRLEKRSESIAQHLEELDADMAVADEPASFVAVLHQLDSLTSQETQEWLMLMRYVEIRGA